VGSDFETADSGEVAVRKTGKSAIMKKKRLPLSSGATEAIFAAITLLSGQEDEVFV